MPLDHRVQVLVVREVLLVRARLDLVVLVCGDAEGERDEEQGGDNASEAGADHACSHPGSHKSTRQRASELNSDESRL